MYIRPSRRLQREQYRSENIHCRQLQKNRFALLCTAKLCKNGVEQLRLTGTAIEKILDCSEESSCYVGNMGQLRQLEQTAQFQHARLQDTSVVHLGWRRDCSHS